MARLESFYAALLLHGTLLGGALAQVTGSWTTGVPMPSARTEVAVAEVDGKIYVVGGFGGERLSVPPSFLRYRGHGCSPPWASSPSRHRCLRAERPSN